MQEPKSNQSVRQSIFHILSHLFFRSVSKTMSLANLKREINRLGFVSDEKIRLLSYFTGNKDRQADALSCLEDLEDKEKCTYLRSLILMPGMQ